MHEQNRPDTSQRINKRRKSKVQFEIDKSNDNDEIPDKKMMNFYNKGKN